MVTAELKGIYTIDGKQLEEYKPEDCGCFQIFIRAMVGLRGSEGQESFDVNVCTPEWLKKEVAKEGFVFGKHYLIVADYNPSLIKKLIRKFVERWSGESWHEVAQKVARIGAWEFEDYPVPNPTTPD